MNPQQPPAHQQSATRNNTTRTVEHKNNACTNTARRLMCGAHSTRTSQQHTPHTTLLPNNTHNTESQHKHNHMTQRTTPPHTDHSPLLSTCDCVVQTLFRHSVDKPAVIGTCSAGGQPTMSCRVRKRAPMSRHVRKISCAWTKRNSRHRNWAATTATFGNGLFSTLKRSPSEGSNKICHCNLPSPLSPVQIVDFSRPS